MIPKILHQIGRTDNTEPPTLLTWEERRLAHIARRMMPDWEYQLWPDSRIERIAEELIPHHIDAYHALPFVVVKIDIVRCLILHKHGGIYFDTDYRFFREPGPDILEKNCILGMEEFELPQTSKLGNAFMASSAGNPLWMDFVEDAFLRVREGRIKAMGDEDDLMYIAGPDALSDFLEENPGKYDVTVCPSEVIYPAFARLKTTARRTPETIGVHLCWGSWRNKPLAQKIKNRGRRLLSAI